MRVCLWLLLFALPVLLCGQVFMRPVDNAAALALGGAAVAYPGTRIGLNNDAVPGFGNKTGIFLGSALPYSIGGWQTARFQGFVRASANDGFGLDIAHAGIEAYNEQRFRFSYGRRMGNGFLLGGSADVLRVSAQEYGNATAVTFNLSALVNPLPDLWLGAQIQNPVQVEMGGAVVPAVLRIGAAWQAANTLILLAETEKDLERPAQIKAGIEYRPVPQIVLRTGIRTEPARVGFGAGLHLAGGIEIDAGAEWHPTLGLTPAAMLVWRRE
ncbi:MAG: hypothetical protein IPM98_06375 [Lewinellaceae bacterium]|nr:hypothetical protein [Lewinellaceae bacterium]